MGSRSRHRRRQCRATGKACAGQPPGQHRDRRRRRIRDVVTQGRPDRARLVPEATQPAKDDVAGEIERLATILAAGPCGREGPARGVRAWRDHRFAGCGLGVRRRDGGVRAGRLWELPLDRNRIPGKVVVSSRSTTSTGSPGSETRGNRRWMATRGAFGCAGGPPRQRTRLCGRTDARQGRRNGASPRGALHRSRCSRSLVGTLAVTSSTTRPTSARPSSRCSLRSMQLQSVIQSDAPVVDLDLPGRGHLESGLQEVNETWAGGPFLEPAPASAGRTRLRCGRHAGPIRADFLATSVGRSAALGHHAWRAPSTKRHAIGRELAARRLGRGGAGPARARSLDARGR